MSHCITSWDDGHPLDLKLAELLQKYNLPAIFFIPIKNQEGRETLNSSEIKELSKVFPIGAHTFHHVDLTTVDDKQAFEEIKSGKDALEQMTGKPVTEFCYPRGHFTQAHIHMVKKLGFSTARTARMLSIAKGIEPFAQHPHFHFFPHHRYIRTLHAVKYMDIPTLLSSLELPEQLEKQVISWSKSITDKNFHIWGHSWEIEEYQLWPQLTKIFQYFQHHAKH